MTLAVAFVVAQVLAFQLWSAPAEFRVLPSVLLVTGTLSAPLVSSRIFGSRGAPLIRGLVFAYGTLGAAGAATVVAWWALFLRQGFGGFGNPEGWGAAMAIIASTTAIAWTVATRAALRSTWTTAARTALPILTIVAAVMLVAFFALVTVVI